MKKAFVILAALLAAAPAAIAQEIPRSEFQLEGFGGVSSISCTVPGAARRPGLGGGGGFLYTWHFHPRWGFTTGVEAAFHQSSLQYSSASGILSGGWDSSGQMFVSYLLGLGEKQNYTQLLVPVMFQYMIPFGSEGHHLYFAAGGKPGFRLAGSYSQEALTYHHTYKPVVPDYDFILPWAEEAAGLEDPYVFYQQVGSLAPSEEMLQGGRYTSGGRFGKFFNILASVELGVRWFQDSSFSFYTGLFLDAGLVSLADGGSPLSSADGSSSSVLSSCAAPVPSVRFSDCNGSKRVEAAIPSVSENLSSRPRTVGFGFKIRFAFGAGKGQ